MMDSTNSGSRVKFRWDQWMIHAAIAETAAQQGWTWQRRVFEFCRRLKPYATGKGLDDHPIALIEHFNQWYEALAENLGDAAPWEEDARGAFLEGWSKVKYPAGEGLLATVTERLRDADTWPRVSRDSRHNKLLALVRDLAKIGHGRFHLSVGVVVEVCEFDRATAWRRLKLLEKEGWIKCIKLGKRPKASRYELLHRICEGPAYCTHPLCDCQCETQIAQEITEEAVNLARKPPS